MVSAFGREQHMVPTQIATDAKPNDVTAVPNLPKAPRRRG
jgi:hypothetical protein